MVRKNVLEEERGVVGEHIQQEKKNKRLGGPKRRTVIWQQKAIEKGRECCGGERSATTKYS
jgi:hypothetical protein